MKNRIASNKTVGAVLLAISLVGFAIFVYRLCCYRFEYDAEFYPVDYGRFNILSYFTVQSNLFAYAYFLFAGLAVLGVKQAEKIGFHAGVQTSVTLYVMAAGAVYCGGLPFGFAPPFTFDTPYHRMTVVIQIFYHMFMPLAAFLLYLFPFTNERLGRRTALLAGVYPIVYSAVSMARGALIEPAYYPYPFYDPAFVWRTLFGERPVNLFAAYAIICAAVLLLGGGLFAALAAVLIKIRNKRIREE